VAFFRLETVPANVVGIYDYVVRVSKRKLPPRVVDDRKVGTGKMNEKKKRSSSFETDSCPRETRRVLYVIIVPSGQMFETRTRAANPEVVLLAGGIARNVRCADNKTTANH